MEHTQTYEETYGQSKIRYTIIPWDSTYLKNTTIEIISMNASSVFGYQQLIQRLKKKHALKKGDLLVYKIPLTEFSKVSMLTDIGFSYIEETVTLTIDLSSWNPQAFHFENKDTGVLTPIEKNDCKKIHAIAKKTFTFDRFHLDPHIQKKYADHRFSMWIENSFKSADTIYKYVDKKKTIIGFFITREEKDSAEFRLAGLDPLYKGRGRGRMMYYAMYCNLKKKGYTRITSVISLNNIPVLNVYMFLTSSICTHPLITLHYNI